jgi:hypothetical protein
MVDQYLNNALKDDAGVQAAVEALRRELRVVSVALDLGVVLLRRGQALADADARKAELEKAEKMFLAIRGVAAQREDYQLGLGQVYYWLGKHDEGHKLFDEFLAAKKRRTEDLLDVSKLLREVGVNAEARALAEEAYNGAAEPAKKFAAAEQRSVLGQDVDDQITWLSRSDQSNSFIKASLDCAQGRKALDEGDRARAEIHLNNGAAGFAALPETYVTLNNGALAYFDLFHATGARDAIDKGNAMLAKAVALKPGDSILLGNVSDHLVQAALWDLVNPPVNLTALKRSGDLDLLPFLYQDRAGRDRLLDRLRKHAGLAKAVASYERTQVLAPKRRSVYLRLVSLRAAARDADALRGLADRLEGVDVELTDALKETRETYQGKKDAKNMERLKAGLKQAAENLAEARKVGGVTLAVALRNLAQWKMGLDTLEPGVDADEVVRLAEEAHAAAPSQATVLGLAGARLWRASRALEKQEPGYAALAKKGGRWVGPTYLVAVALTEKPELRPAILANADVKQALELVKDSAARFPDDPSEWQWALLSAAYPKEAGQIAEALRKDALTAAVHRLHRKLDPLGAVSALEQYWASRAAGNDAEAAAVVRRAVAEGVPLPLEAR